MKRFVLIVFLTHFIFPSLSAQSTDLIKYDKEVIKAFLLDKIKAEKSLRLDEAQLELMGYKLDDYFTDLAKKLSYGLTQQQIAELQDSTKMLSSLRKDMNKLNKASVTSQAEIERLKADVQNLKQQKDDLQETVKQLKGYKDAVGQMDVLKDQLQANEEKHQADLKQAAENRDKEMASIKEKHDKEIAELDNRLKKMDMELSEQREIAKDLQLKEDDLNSLLKAKEEELLKWQGGVTGILTSIENQCSSTKESSLEALSSSAFQASVNSFDGIRSFVKEIDPERVSSIDSQIEEAFKLMKVAEAFKEASEYIQGHQDATIAQVQINQLNSVRGLSKLSANQLDEFDSLLSALKNQGPLYGDFREYLSLLRSKMCLPTKDKIEEELKLIGKLEEMDGFLLSTEYHKSYVAALETLKDNLQKAANNDRKMAPIVKDDARFPGMIDAIVKML